MKRAIDAEGSAPATLNDQRWIAVVSRDRRAENAFIYSVSTTGVYCRPSCGARTPRPEHVTFHASAADAARAGFRPCKRCKPDEMPRAALHSALVAKLCRLIEDAEHMPTLEVLARHAGLSTYHLHRVFKAAVGVTPKAYGDAHRAKRVRAELETGTTTVTQAIYEGGYGSSGNFYEAGRRILGMTPSAFRAGGTDVTIRFAVGECTLGSILVAASARGVCSILLGDEPESLVRDLQDRFARATLVGGDQAFAHIVAKVVGFIDRPGVALDLPLDIRGTAFQQRVWRALTDIPVGARVSYTELARRVGSPKSVRAVAGACAANPIAVAIPCHRVVRIDGGLSGYRWGVERKQALLDRESGDAAKGS